MSNISGQLIKDSYNYVLQSDLISGIVYRIGGSIAENPKFVSGLTVNASFTYSDGSEFDGFVLTCDASGNATWAPVSAATSGIFVTGGTFDYSAGTLELRNSNGSQVTISGLTDTYVTGGTVSGNTIVFTYNDTNTFEVSGITSFDTFTSYTASTEIILNSKVDVSTFNQFAQDTNIALNQRLEISSFTAYTATTQPLILNAVTGGTYSGGTLYLKNNSGTTIPITGFTDYVDDNFVHITGDTMTGRLNVPTLSAQTITATTIENVQYVDFTVNTPNPSALGGRVFFNQNEQSLSYYSYLNNPVVVNTGQQLYLRVFNNTVSAITKGSVVTIISQSNGLPAITLSVNSSTGTTGLVAGLAAETIPSGSSGLTITNGILSDLNIPSTYTPGDTIYLDYDDPGQFSNAVPNFPLSARTNEIGYIIETGTTTGKVYVNINNENIQLSLTDLQRNVLEGNVISTGIFAFSGLSLVSASGTTFNIAPVQAWFVENTSNYLKPTVQYITYSGQSNVPAIYVNTATQTYILLTPSGTILQQTSFPTPQQRRENVYLGKLGHANKTFLINAFNEPDFDVSPLSQLRDMFTPIRLINGGIYPSPNGVNLSFNTSAGVLYGLGIGWVLNTLNPDSISVSGTSPCTFQYRTQTGGTASNTTLINPTVYDNLGVLTAVGGGSNSSTNQRIYLVQNGQFRLQYGQQVYPTLAEAVSNAQNEAFTTFSNFRDNAILIAILSVNKNATNLSDTTQAKFLLVSKFGETVGASGGISTTNLQQAYDNSVEPEIVINSTLDGVSIKNGTGNADNVSQLLQGINSGGTVTSFIRADGAISGSTIYGNGSGLTHVFNSVKINGTTQFSAGTDTFINFSGINVTISSGANNTIIFSAGTGGGGSGSGTSITGGAFTYTGNTFSGGTLTLTDSNGTPIPISGLRDTFVTGGTYNGSQITFTNNSGSTFVVSGLTASGFSANYYGSFSDSTNQPLSGANTPTVWKYNTTELSNGITVVDNTKITVANTGVYEIGYSPQIEKTQGTGAIVTIWAAINGNPVARSSSTLGLVSNSVLQLPFVSFIFELNANDYVEFYFSSDNEFVQLTALSGLTTPTRPDSPSVIIVAKQVGLAVSQGGTGDTFVTGFSLTNDVLTLSQNTNSQYSGFSVNLSGYSPSITGATSVGSGTSIYDSTTDKVINIKSITSDTTNKVSVTSQNQTIELGVNEQNLTLWNLVVQGNKLLNGSVSYVSGLTFSVSPLEYLINGQIYTISAETTVTLASGDSTFDRIDVIYADISGNTGVLQGTPSDNPEKPLVDGDTEIEVTFVLVRANSTSADVSTFVIYNENSGPPSEWTFGSGGVQPTRIIGNFTGVTYSGGTSIRVSGVTGAYTTFFRLTGLTELNTNNYSTLQFAIRNLSANTTTSLIRFRFLTTGGTQNGSVVTMNGAGTANVVQYSPTNVSTWQLISIPLWRFYLTNTNVQVLEVSFSPQGTGAQSRYYFDLLEFVEGTSSAPPSNSWTTIQGDSVATTITAPNPNATLILSGGTNISSTISGTSTVVFNLDNNINLNGVTATTISATTYQNLPTDIRVTGGTYSNGNTTFRNNTGGTFTVTGSATYSSGILSGSSNWVSNGNGSVNLPAVQVALYNNSSYTEPVQVYTVSSGVTGSGGIAALTNNDTNYIYIEYNNGSPRWGVSTDNSFINGSDVDLCYLIYRADNFVHVLDFGNEGAGLPNKISNRIVAVNRFGRESGFSLGLSGATGVVTLTSGVAWNGTNRQSLVAVNSQDDIFFKSFHSGGTWVYTTTGDTINNTYYDDGTDIVSGTTSKYLVNWYFRGQEVNDHLYEVYGTDEYDSVAEAQLSIEPSLPELITSHAFLTGRIIVQVGATTGLVESAFVQVFQSTQVTQHNDLTSIQGGTAGQYYHLTASEYSNNAYTNVDNNFSVGQTISGGLTADTVSATTYQNLPISGLTEGSNISITGSNGNFTVSVTGITSGGSFTGNTSASCVNDFYVSNIFGCSGITTLQTSIQTVDSTVNGTLSHAEGNGTSVGTVLAYSGTVVSGLISLDPIYGDLTGEFVSGDYLFLDDSQFDANVGKNSFLIDTVNFTTQTDIQLVDFTVTSTTIYVLSTVNFTFWVGDKIIYSNYSHAEGAGNVTINNYSHSEGRFSVSFGLGSHAEGYFTKTIGAHSHSEGNDTFSIGDYSHAEGEAVKSVGNYSHAEGQNSISTGEHSHAEGRGTQSIGVFSHSEGRETESIGDGSHAEGYLTDSVGNFSHSEGRNSISLGIYSHAEGRSISSGDTSHAEGEFTKSIGIGSHSEGGYSNSGYLGYSGNSVGQTITLNSTYGDLTPLFSGATAVVILDDSKFDNINGVTSIGVTANTYNGTNTVLIAKTPISSTTTCIITLPNNPNPTLADITNGGGSHSEGFYTGTHGVGSHAEGYSGRSYGDYSHVEGLNSRTFGKYSHAEGGGTTYADNSHAEGLGASFGQYSHAEGGGNSLGQYSHAEGGGTSYGDYSHAQGGGITYGTQSFAQGSGSVASGDSSSAIGYFTITSTDYQIALGKLNTTGNTTSLLVIGNGTSSINRSDLALFNQNSIVFNAPFSATSISATTYQNVNAVTGGTYAAGQITLSGTGNVNGTQISTKILPVALTVVSNTASTDASLSSTFTLTLTGNTTLATPTNGFSGQRILYQLKQDGTGSKLLTLSSGFRSGPITVTLSTAANTTDYLGVIYNAIDDRWDVLALNKGYS